MYACLENGGSCTPLYQGETAYSTPTAPNTSTAGDYLLASLNQSGHPYVTPQGNFGTPVTRGQAWRAVQAGCNIYNLAFHDSKIINAPGYSLTWAGLGTNKGYIRVYNNEIINSGNNWNWNVADASAAVCLNFQDPMNDDGHEPAAGGDIEIYNNTFYNCGKVAPFPATVPGVISTSWRNPNFPTRRFVFRNNIFVQPQKGQTWLSDSPNPLPANLQITGSNNLCWGFSGHNCPVSWNAKGGAINSDPLFTSAGRPTPDPSGKGGVIYLDADLTPRQGSPVVDAGYDTSNIVNYDLLESGVLRANP